VVIQAGTKFQNKQQNINHFALFQDRAWGAVDCHNIPKDLKAL